MKWVDLDVDNEKPMALEAADAPGIIITAVVIASGAAFLAGFIWCAHEVLSWII